MVALCTGMTLEGDNNTCYCFLILSHNQYYSQNLVNVRLIYKGYSCFFLDVHHIML